MLPLFSIFRSRFISPRAGEVEVSDFPSVLAYSEGANQPFSREQ
jgi:hypothetical protein